jgi:hypothetical protein
MGKRGSPFATELPRIEQRNAEIVRRYKAGEDLAGIGVDLDLTRERIPQGRRTRIQPAMGGPGFEPGTVGL